MMIKNGSKKALNIIKKGITKKQQKLLTGLLCTILTTLGQYIIRLRLTLKSGDEENALLQFERVYYMNPNPKIKQIIDELKGRVRGSASFFSYPLTYNINAAVNYGSYSSEYTYGFSSYSSMSPGGSAIFSYHVMDRMCVTSGIIFEGMRGSFYDESYYDTYIIETWSADIPVYLDFRISLPWNDNIAAAVAVGGYLGIPVSSDVRGYYGEETDITVSPASDYGLALDIGVYYYMGKFAFVISESFLFGLTDVYGGLNAKKMLYGTSVGVAF